MKFFDCIHHAPAAPADLFVVEGDSAAEAVCAVRNCLLQAVLPVQGKPMNAMRSSPARLLGSPWFRTLTAALGSAPGTALPLGELRYARVILLFDPDADGIHAAALVQLFLYRCMPTLLESGKVEIVHAPWGEIRIPGEAPRLSWHAAEYQQHSRAVSGREDVQRLRYRGLGGITPTILESTCVNPATRRSRVLTMTDVQAAVQLFGR